MADFLLELYSEEIPAGMQAGAAAQLERHIAEFLAGFGVEASQLASYVAPQRVALLADGLASHLPNRTEQKKGPRIDAPQKAIDGFLRANGLDSTDGLSVCDDPKGAFYMLEIDQPGRPLAAALAEFLPTMVAGFQWPKAMRWGAGSLRWVRPLRGILCVFDGAVVPFEVGGLASGQTTYGHRFMAPEALTITRAADYLATLEKAHVLADAPVREAMIAEGAAQLAAGAGCTLVEDSALICETAGLVEWPVPLLGKIDKAFMALPEEVLRSVMRTHQKYFALRADDGKLAPYFITVSNMQTDDNGAAIIAGNERVLRARLADAQFFWEQDKKIKLETRLLDLEKVVFHAKLGNMYEKSERMEKSVASMARIGDSVDQNGRTIPTTYLSETELASKTKLAKADLVSGMVSEFPELQGIIGGYLAKEEGLGEITSIAIAEHYKPLGPNDDIPTSPEGRLLSLADKLDTLVGFWLIGEKPTGSKDPYALRRAALGVIRILLDKWLSQFEIENLLDIAFQQYETDSVNPSAIKNDLKYFFIERLKVYLREKENIRYDIVDAVSYIHEAGFLNVYELANTARALNKFLATEDGLHLVAAYKRAYGICREETSLNLGGAVPFPLDLDEDLLQESAEKALYKKIRNASENSTTRESLENKFRHLATLRAPVDRFFNEVLVNVDDATIRENRIELLGELVSVMNQYADFSKIEGRG